MWLEISLSLKKKHSCQPALEYHSARNWNSFIYQAKHSLQNFAKRPQGKGEPRTTPGWSRQSAPILIWAQPPTGFSRHWWFNWPTRFEVSFSGFLLHVTPHLKFYHATVTKPLVHDLFVVEEFTHCKNGSCSLIQLFSRPKVSKNRCMISQEPFLQRVWTLTSTHLW